MQFLYADFGVFTGMLIIGKMEPRIIRYCCDTSASIQGPQKNKVNSSANAAYQTIFLINSPI